MANNIIKPSDAIKQASDVFASAASKSLGVTRTDYEKTAKHQIAEKLNEARRVA